MSKSLNILEVLSQALLEPLVESPLILKPVTPASFPKPTKAKSKKSKTGWKCALILTDQQIGWRRYEDGTLDPFHDVQALNLSLQFAQYLEETYGLDKIINTGDFIDLPMFGKYAQENAFYNTINESLKSGYDYLAGLRAIAPSAEIVLIEGNHDCRINKYINFNAMAASRMMQVGSEIPAMSLPHLMRFDEIGVTYVEGYPADKFKINDRLIARHGTTAVAGSTAMKHVNSNHHESVIYGHSHRTEMMYKTHDTPKGMVQNTAYSPGCLCRIDGAVPSFKGGVKINERPVKQFENWQQGLGVLWYKDSGDFAGANDFHIDHVHIMDGWAMYSGQEFRSTIK